MANLAQPIEERGYRARADRSIQSGRVVTVNKTTHTAILDVGMVDNNGDGVYLIDVPFSPQSPPHPQDVVAIVRTSSSPYSMVIGAGAQVGGANSGQIVEAGGAVTSIKKTGETSGQQGDIVLDPGSNVTITRTGKTFTIAAALSSLSPATTVTDVAASSAIGTSVNYAREDHAHKGVHTFAKSGSTGLSGDVTVTGTGGIVLTQSGQNVAIDGSGIGGGSGVSVEVSGGTEFGPKNILNYIPGTFIDSIVAALNGTDIDVTINAADQSGTVNSHIGGYQFTGVATTGIGYLNMYRYNTGTSGNQAVTLGDLYAAAGTNAVLCLIYANDSAFDVTLTANTSVFANTIEGTATLVIKPGQRYILVGVQGPGSDLNWSVVLRYPTLRGYVITLCEGFTPAGTGADIAEAVAPFSPEDGTTSITWQVRRIDFRVQTAGGAPSVTVEKSTASGAFSASTLGTVTLGSGASEGAVTSALGSVVSGDKIRFNVGTLATATGWTVQVLLGQ